MKRTTTVATVNRNPGSPDAIGIGCTCPPGWNHDGRFPAHGYRDGLAEWKIRWGCPLHFEAAMAVTA